MALTITVTANGYFQFTPSSGRVKGDLNPKARLDGENIDFLYNDNTPMFPRVLYSDIIIIDASSTEFDEWNNASEVMDKLKELEL